LSREFGRHVRGGPPASKKFDLDQPPMKARLYLMLPLWCLSFFMKLLHRGRLRKVGMEGIKPPYLLLCNHNSGYDYYVIFESVFPHRAYYPSAVDDFISREQLWRRLGTIPKRKYVADLSLVRRCWKILKQGDIFVITPEARYSLCGVTELMPDAVGQMARRMGVPVVTLKTCGHHIYDPFWGNRRRRWVAPMEAVMTRIYTAEEIKTAPPEEINAKIRAQLRHDDFRWQSENRVKVRYRKRAEGLHKPLYQCPHCLAEYRMQSQGARLFCGHCGKSWTLGIYGALSADCGETEFQFATDWYQWEREQVRREVRSGAYRLDCAVDVNDLPNPGGFVRMGRGRLVHNLDGFRLTGLRDYDGAPFEMHLPAASQIAIHVEYSYRFGQYRDCIDLTTMDDTRYCYPAGQDFSVTKVSLATEEIYVWLLDERQKQKGRPYAQI